MSSAPAAQTGTFTLENKLAAVIGARTAQAIERAFGYRTVGDLLGHYPRRYAHRGELTKLSELPLDEMVTVVAEVLEVRGRSMKARRGHIVEAAISDGTGQLTLTFFNQPFREAELRPGRRGIFSGKVGIYKGGRQLAHPDYQFFDELDAESADAHSWAQAPIPIYAATAAMPSWKIAKAIQLVLEGLAPLADPIPASVRAEQEMAEHREALIDIHRPRKDSDWKIAQHGLRFAEAFMLQIELLRRRAKHRTDRAIPREPHVNGFRERFDAALPFELTQDQRIVGEAITADLAQTHPMHRLVQGEVGSGKTLVALRAMLSVADSGGQSALLAPTEVLAAQHLRSIVDVLGPDLAAVLMPTLVTGQLPVADRRRALLRIAAGQSRIVVGTHALLGERVDFADLGLVVIDEQHRFGVEQREALRLKGGSVPPHVLVLTATPIPRTVAMTVFGDLDISTISELPSGRAGITSQVVPLAIKPDWEPRVWERLAEEVALGRQGFVVCPAISAKESEDGTEIPIEPETEPNQLVTVESVLAELRTHPNFGGIRVAPLHGRMTANEKDTTMRSYAAGEIDVLIATTVIEVGVDVPNASVMVVMDADRFGVSQLHQLRGRVGRGSVPGLCLLVTHAPRGSIALTRVEAVAATLDGFELARVDLELRQEGDVLGKRQSGGRSSLKLLRVARDGDVIVAARDAAAGLLSEDPDLEAHPALAAAVARRLDEETSDFLGKS